jgi:hypothetical protein
MVDRPERVATEPTVPRRILAAAGSAAVATLIRKALEPAVQHLVNRARLAASAASDPDQASRRPKSPPAA